MFLRTDLAVERRELIGKKIPDGVLLEEITDGDIKTTKIEITNENGVKALEKPEGKYYTVEFESALSPIEENDSQTRALTDALDELLPADGTVLVAGLGNENITPDALGPDTVNGVFATRHIVDKSERLGLPALREVAVISTGVLGQTGMETVEILRAVSEKVKPSAVIVIDALATMNSKRLGRTVQLTDTGICPGSGVGNSRARIDEKTLGVKVISVGVPTVIDANTLCESDKDNNVEQMMVTPRDIDRVIADMSRLLSVSINLSLQKNLSLSDLNSLF